MCLTSSCRKRQHLLEELRKISSWMMNNFTSQWILMTQQMRRAKPPIHFLQKIKISSEELVRIRLILGPINKMIWMRCSVAPRMINLQIGKQISHIRKLMTQFWSHVITSLSTSKAQQCPKIKLKRVFRRECLAIEGRWPRKTCRIICEQCLQRPKWLITSSQLKARPSRRVRPTRQREISSLQRINPTLLQIINLLIKLTSEHRPCANLASSNRRKKWS